MSVLDDDGLYSNVELDHTVSVIKGRAYLFGGQTISKEGEGVEVSDNGVHIVILPSSGIESTDYMKIEASNDSPSRRYGTCIEFNLPLRYYDTA